MIILIVIYDLFYVKGYIYLHFEREAFTSYINYIMILYNQSLDFVLISSYDVAYPIARHIFMMKWHSFSQIIHYVGGILIIEWMDDG
jgi:hypothetical protein